MKLMTNGTWQVRALRSFLLGDGVRSDPQFSAETAAYQRRINDAWGGRELEKVLSSPGCEPLRASLVAHMRAVEGGRMPAQGPFRGSVLARTAATCLPDARGATSTKFNFITVDAEDVEHIAVAAVTPTSFYYEELTVAQSFTFHGRRMLLAVVPRNAYSVVAVRQANLLVPKVLAQVVPGDRAYFPDETATGCVILDMTLNADDRVFLDGHSLETRGRRTDRLLLVPTGDHTLTVIRPRKQGSRFAIVYDEKIAVRDDIRCERVALDLSVESRVALLGVFREGNCSAELTVPGVVSLVREEFRQRGESLVEMDAQNALLETTLSASRHATPAATTRASRDWAKLLTDLARAHWRRGFDRMLFFELRCDRFGSLVTHNELSVHVVDRSAWSEEGHATGAVRSHSLEIESVEAADEAVATLVDTALGKHHARFVRAESDPIRTGAVDYFWSPTPVSEGDQQAGAANGAESLQLALFELPGFDGRRELRQFCRRPGPRRKNYVPFILPFTGKVGDRVTSHLRARRALVTIAGQGTRRPLDRQGGQWHVEIKNRFLQDSLAVLYRDSAEVEIEDAICIRSGRMRGGTGWVGLHLLLSAHGRGTHMSDTALGIEAGHVWRLNRLLGIGGLLRYGAVVDSRRPISNDELVGKNDAGESVEVLVFEASQVSLNRKHSVNLGLVIELAPAWPVAPLFRVTPYVAGNIVPGNIRPFELAPGLDLNLGVVVREQSFGMLFAFRADLPALDTIRRRPDHATIAYSDDLMIASIPVEWASRVRLGMVFTVNYNWGEAMRNYDWGEFLTRRRRARRR